MRCSVLGCKRDGETKVVGLSFHGCTYAVNVATLAYERRIRGVYQATRLTIFTAWMHTACWLLAALLALVRVLLVVDFRLVRVRAELRGNIDKMLERHEQHLRTISPEIKSHDEYTTPKTSSSTSVQLKNQPYELDSHPIIGSESVDSIHTIHYVALKLSSHSKMALLPEEEMKIDHIKARNYRLVIQILDDVLDSLPFCSSESSSDSLDLIEGESFIVRQVGQRKISSEQFGIKANESIEPEEAKERAKAFRQQMKKKISNPPPPMQYVSHLNITPELEQVIKQRTRYEGRMRSKKSNLKTKGNQTEINTKSKGTQQKVHIADSKTYNSPASEETLKPLISEGEISVDDGAPVPTEDKVAQSQGKETLNKETQTPPKEKQD